MTDTEDRLMTDTAQSEADTPTAETTEAAPQRRWLWVVLAVIGIAAVIAVIVAATSGGSDDSAAEETLNTATVQRTDVVAMETLSGTLGYGTAEAVVFQSSPDGVLTLEGIKQGFVTAIVDAGTVIESGDVLYDVNTEPVVVLNGDLPAYRSFTSNMSDGPDVEQLFPLKIERAKCSRSGTAEQYLCRELRRDVDVTGYIDKEQCELF